MSMRQKGNIDVYTTDYRECPPASRISLLVYTNISKQKALHDGWHFSSCSSESLFTFDDRRVWRAYERVSERDKKKTRRTATTASKWIINIASRLLFSLRIYSLSVRARGRQMLFWKGGLDATFNSRSLARSQPEQLHSPHSRSVTIDTFSWNGRSSKWNPSSSFSSCVWPAVLMATIKSQPKPSPCWAFRIKCSEVCRKDNLLNLKLALKLVSPTICPFYPAQTSPSRNRRAPKPSSFRSTSLDWRPESMAFMFMKSEFLLCLSSGVSQGKRVPLGRVVYRSHRNFL